MNKVIAIVLNYIDPIRSEYVSIIRDVYDKVFKDTNVIFKVIETIKLSEPFEEYINNEFYNKECYLIFIDPDIISEYEYISKNHPDNITPIKMTIKSINSSPSDTGKLISILENNFKKLKDKMNIDKKELNNIEDKQEEVKLPKYNIEDLLNIVGKHFSKLQNDLDNIFEMLYDEGLEIETDKFKFIIVATQKQKEINKTKYHNKGYIILTLKEATVLTVLSSLTNSNIVNIKGLNKEEE